MKKEEKHIEALPEEFSSYEEASEFWETHDTMDYLDSFEDVEVNAKFKRRHYEVELDEDLIKVIRKRAKRKGISTTRLVNEMLRQDVSVTS